MHTARWLHAAPALLPGLGIALPYFCAPLGAQPVGRGPAAGRSAASADPLKQLAQRLSRRWKVVVLVDPAVPRSSPAETPADDLPIEPSLDLALASLRRVSWRRVRLPSEQAEVPPVEVLAAAARALEQQEMGSLLSEDPATKRLTACLKDEAIPSSLERLSERPRPTAAPLYLVYSITPPREGEPPARRFAELQRQQLELPAPPESRAQAMVQMMRLLHEMPPADREQFASRTLQAGMPLWESTPPEQRQEMIQQSLQIMKAFDAALQRDAARGAAPRRPLPTGDGRRRGDPKALAATLSDRFKATVIVDPALLVESPPELPPADAPIEEALAAVSAALPGSAWRRVYLTEAQLERLPAAERLAAWVRALEQLETGNLVLQDVAKRRATTYRKAEPLASLSVLRRRGGLTDQPVYLLYSTTPLAHGGTPEERLVDLQRQQIGLMLRMSPEQMAQSMTPAIRAFPSADPETRARLMGLPAMAGLMAVWMPREAKESGKPPAP